MCSQNVVSSERGLGGELFVGSHECLDFLTLGENVGLQSSCSAKGLVPVWSLALS